MNCQKHPVTGCFFIEHTKLELTAIIFCASKTMQQALKYLSDQRYLTLPTYLLVSSETPLEFVLATTG